MRNYTKIPIQKQYFIRSFLLLSHTQKKESAHEHEQFIRCDLQNVEHCIKPFPNELYCQLITISKESKGMNTHTLTQPNMAIMLMAIQFQQENESEKIFIHREYELGDIAVTCSDIYKIKISVKPF